MPGEKFREVLECAPFDDAQPCAGHRIFEIALER